MLICRIRCIRILSLWRIISNESSYGKIGFNEEGNKQIFIFYRFLATVYGLTSRRIMYYLQAFKILALGYWRSEQNGRLMVF